MAKKVKKVGVGIIGAGGIAQNAHMPGYAAIPEQCEIVAVADSNKEVARAAAAKFGVKNVLTDYTKLLEMDEVHAVSVCTPNYLHFEPTVQAFKAGKHVLCEKPVAMNAAEARKMVDAGRKAKKKFMVGYNMRFAPSSQLLKRYIDAGELGEVYYARAQALRRRGIPGWGVFIDKAKQGGGPLIDIGVHILDLTLWLMGHPKPVLASGVTYAKFGTRSDVVGFMGQWDYKNFTVEDFASALVRFDNGASIVLEASFVANIAQDVFNSTLCGTQGGATTTPVTIVKEAHRSLQTFQPEIPNAQANTHSEEVKHFVECILQDREPLVTGEHGLMVAEIMDAIYKSSEKGCEVQVG
ncbi:MAG TPA: Gfo/Idh/MocA family oxidoreductase [Chthonomonadales bacterium]|nr:Gfo/Idh/MocA family oxidoreductase [Chthonomonadales bacterium]